MREEVRSTVPARSTRSGGAPRGRAGARSTGCVAGRATLSPQCRYCENACGRSSTTPAGAPGAGAWQRRRPRATLAAVAGHGVPVAWPSAARTPDPPSFCTRRLAHLHRPHAHAPAARLPIHARRRQPHVRRRHPVGLHLRPGSAGRNSPDQPARTRRRVRLVPGRRRPLRVRAAGHPAPVHDLPRSHRRAARARSLHRRSMADRSERRLLGDRGVLPRGAVPCPLAARRAHEFAPDHGRRRRISPDRDRVRAGVSGAGAVRSRRLFRRGAHPPGAATSRTAPSTSASSP